MREKRSPLQAGEYSNNIASITILLSLQISYVEADANEVGEDKYYLIVNAAIR